VDPAAEARANHARMHGAPPWANDPEVLVRPRSGSAAARARSHLNDSVALSGCDGGAQGQGAAGDHDVARGSRGRFKVCCSRHLCPALDTCRASRSTQARVATSLRALRTIFEDPELSQKFSFLQSVRLSRFPYPCSLSRALTSMARKLTGVSGHFCSVASSARPREAAAAVVVALRPAVRQVEESHTKWPVPRWIPPRSASWTRTSSSR
jgi:hypothetical protein